MKKRAQGLSMTTIVVAVLALIVLVVLVLIFTGRMGEFTTGIKGVGNCNQACTAAGYDSGAGNDACASPSVKLSGIKEGNVTCCCT